MRGDAEKVLSNPGIESMAKAPVTDTLFGR
jgi:hypothetical protein